MENWSAAMVPDEGHTSLVLECFCTRGDAFWRLTDEEMDILEKCVGRRAPWVK